MHRKYVEIDDGSHGRKGDISDFPTVWSMCMMKMILGGKTKSQCEESHNCTFIQRICAVLQGHTSVQEGDHAPKLSLCQQQIKTLLLNY